MRIMILTAIILLTGCSHTKELELYLDAQKTLNKDSTVIEAAKINALKDIAIDSKDTNVKIEAIKSLQQIQNNKRVVNIEQPKKNWLGF